jgi:hypothetical protein
VLLAKGLITYTWPNVILTEAGKEKAFLLTEAGGRHPCVVKNKRKAKPWKGGKRKRGKHPLPPLSAREQQVLDFLRSNPDPGITEVADYSTASRRDLLESFVWREYKALSAMRIAKMLDGPIDMTNPPLMSKWNTKHWRLEYRAGRMRRTLNQLVARGFLEKHAIFYRVVNPCDFPGVTSS